MIIISNVLTGLAVAITTLIITRWLNNHKDKKTALGKLAESVTEVVTRMDGIESFGKKMPIMESQIMARKEICENNHRPWDGIDRRKMEVRE
jgi:hypothetical protein